MKTKAIPAIVMLTAGFISCVFSICKGQDFLTFAKTLILVMLIFYVLGGVAAWMIQKIFNENREKEEEEKSEETEGETDSDEKSEKDETEKEK